METAAIEKLFLEYEKAFNDLDIKRNAEMFADTFISAGPKGAIAQGKKDFLEKAGQAAEFYKSAGQTSAKIISKNIIPVSDQYLMVTVHWGVTFKKTGDELIEFDVSYIIYEGGDEPRIILFIAHQDEEEAMKKLGLLKNLQTA
jgi:ketosteroid isomerase-like protein